MTKKYKENKKVMKEFQKSGMVSPRADEETVAARALEGEREKNKALKAQNKAQQTTIARQSQQLVALRAEQRHFASQILPKFNKALEDNNNLQTDCNLMKAKFDDLTLKYDAEKMKGKRDHLEVTHVG